MTDDKLREILDSLDGDWFFERLAYRNEKYKDIEATDLMCLPQKYREKLEMFVSSHSMDELGELKERDFIEQSMCEPLEKAVKIIEVHKRIKELNQDFN